MGFFDFLSGDLVESVGKVADELVTSDEERLEKANEKLKTELSYKANIQKLGIEKEKAYLEDKQSARAMNSDLVASKDWLVRNTGSLLAWFVVGGTVALDYLMAFGSLKEAVADKDILMFILGSMNTYTAGVISFYFGSSKTEADNKRFMR